VSVTLTGLSGLLSKAPVNVQRMRDLRDHEHLRQQFCFIWSGDMRVWSGDLRVNVAHILCAVTTVSRIFAQLLSHTFFSIRSSLTHFVLLDRLTHFAGLRSVQRSSLAWVMLGSSYSIYKLPAISRFLRLGVAKPKTKSKQSQ
jgi:hypothetical protein